MRATARTALRHPVVVRSGPGAGRAVAEAVEADHLEARRDAEDLAARLERAAPAEVAHRTRAERARAASSSRGARCAVCVGVLAEAVARNWRPPPTRTPSPVVGRPTAAGSVESPPSRGAATRPSSDRGVPRPGVDRVPGACAHLVVLVLVVEAHAPAAVSSSESSPGRRSRGPDPPVAARRRSTIAVVAAERWRRTSRVSRGHEHALDEQAARRAPGATMRTRTLPSGLPLDAHLVGAARRRDLGLLREQPVERERDLRAARRGGASSARPAGAPRRGGGAPAGMRHTARAIAASSSLPCTARDRRPPSPPATPAEQPAVEVARVPDEALIGG